MRVFTCSSKKYDKSKSVNIFAKESSYVIDTKDRPEELNLY